MATHTVSPAIIEKIIYAPPSKSMAQRALLATLISPGSYIISNIGDAADTLDLIEILKQIGVECTIRDNVASVIVPERINIPDVIKMGESGLAARMLFPIISTEGLTVTFTGSGSLNYRKMYFVSRELPKLGLDIQSNNDTLPITISGKLLSKDIIVDGGESSQDISGLIYAYTKLEAQDITITVDNMVSVDYIDMSIEVLESFGYNNIKREDNRIIFSKKKSYLPTRKYEIEADWSNASIWLIAGAIAGNIKVKGLNLFTAQGDKKILEALQDVGCYLSINMDYIQVRKNKFMPFYFDATHTPDLIPPLVVLAAMVDGISVIVGAQRLINKESNRAQVLISEFGKMGLKIELQNDELIIYGTSNLVGASVDAHNDHRIAMSLAIAGLVAEGDTVINGSECVAKSYPDFWEVFRK